ncbi:outer membrane protein assembly factor BamA [soil metagenome]
MGISLRQWAAGMLAALALAVGVPGHEAQAQGTAVFSRIDVAGNQRIDADTVRVFAGIEPGQAVAPEDLNLAVRRLFASGLFQTVEVMPEAGRLVITVVENPTINQIAFEGNRRIDDETLGGSIALRPRQAYSVTAAEADAQRVIDAYRADGRFDAQVTPVIIRQPDNRVDLVFEIFEGRVTPIQRVTFIGNTVYSDARLRRVVETSQANPLSFLFGGFTFDEGRLERDRELLRQFYLERGYVNFRVVSSTAELAQEGNAFFVAFTIDEGERYSFAAPSVVSRAPGLDAEDFRPLLSEIRPGAVYNVRQVERVIERMAFQAGQQGFAFAQIVPQVSLDDRGRTVAITFEIVEGERVFVERIDISGNTRTLDRVIRRQFNLVEGDAFNAREVRQAEERIRALGFFSASSVDVQQGSQPGTALVRVAVEEQPTGSLNLGAAFSTNEGIAAQVGITERNFLGRGQTVSGAFSGSSQFRNFQLGFTEPALLDRDLLAGFNAYLRDSEFDEQAFKTTNIGFEPRVGFPLSENGRLTLRYRISSDEIRDVEPTSSAIIRDEAGRRLTSAVGLTYAYDLRNSAIDPTAGFILTLNQDLAGLGGDVTHSRTDASARAYTSFLDEDLVLAATLEGGAIFADGATRITDRFSTGGDGFRGFARNGLGPRDRCEPGECVRGPGDVSVDEGLGGNYYAVARFDASFPLGLPTEYGIFGGLFADVGSVWGLDNTAGSMGEVDDSFSVRASAGVSLIFETAFAPLRFNWAVPLREVDGDVIERFRFTIQTRF